MTMRHVITHKNQVLHFLNLPIGKINFQTISYHENFYRYVSSYI